MKYTALRYAVTAALPDECLAAEYLAWLTSGHIAAVLAGGAQHAEVVRLDVEQGQPPQIEVHYTFASRAVFDEYTTNIAPKLRAEGVQRFAARGVTFSRRVGIIEAQLGQRQEM